MTSNDHFEGHRKRVHRLAITVSYYSLIVTVALDARPYLRIIKLGGLRRRNVCLAIVASDLI